VKSEEVAWVERQRNPGCTAFNPDYFFCVLVTELREKSFMKSTLPAQVSADGARYDYQLPFSLFTFHFLLSLK
jgi:hypothetical protein